MHPTEEEFKDEYNDANEALNEHYYVYAHATPDGEIFYVGKGSGRRMFFAGNRSVFWKRIVKKYGYTALLLEQGLSEAGAYEREVFWIAHYKSLGQCAANFTDGGDGVRVAKRWWSDKISAALMGIKRPSGKESATFKDVVSKEDLKRMYEVERLPSTTIAKMVGTSYTTICTRLKAYGIARRNPGIPRKESHG